MSVKGCYTDFHIDFGGTSVWYHILRGGKVFWLIPPTEKNIQLYEQWTLSGKQSKVFFGDTVENCARVTLTSGNTFLIPTGWIHAVYTEEDSLVFGGNFLHSYGIEKQLRVAKVEETTKVPSKFRYPFYTMILWYVLVRYVHCLTGKNYLAVDDEGNSLLVDENKDQNNIKTEAVKTEIKKEEEEILESNQNAVTTKSDPFDTDTEDEDFEEIERQLKERELYKPKMPRKPFRSFYPSSTLAKVHLSKFELTGLRAIVKWLTTLSPSKRAIPDLLISPEALLSETRNLIEDHLADKHEQSITNRPVLFWLTKKAMTNGHHETKLRLTVPPGERKPFGGTLKRPKSPLGASNDSGIGIGGYKVSSGTTLKSDLILSSFEGLIAQTGRSSGGIMFNNRPTPPATKPTDGRTPIAVVVNSTKASPAPATSPAYTPKSPQTPAPPLAPPISTYQYGGNYGQVAQYYQNQQQPPTGSYPHHHQHQQQQPHQQAYRPPPQAVISAEHAYTTNPALYQNPHLHHNYAYHPYRPAGPTGTTTTTNGVATSATPRLSHTSPSTSYPIRPIPTVVQAVAPNGTGGLTIHKPTAQVATVQMPLIVRPVAATPAYVQPGAASVTYQPYQPTAYTTGYQTAPVAQSVVNGGPSYYQYYPQQQAVQVIQPQANANSTPQTQQARAQLVYYHNPSQQQAPQPPAQQQSIIIGTVPTPPYQQQQQQAKPVMYSGAQYSQVAGHAGGLYSAPSPQPLKVSGTHLDQPSNIYYVANTMANKASYPGATPYSTASAAPSHTAYTYTPNQTYLMTTHQPYSSNAAPAQAVHLVNHHTHPAPTHMPSYSSIQSQPQQHHQPPTVQSQVPSVAQYSPVAHSSSPHPQVHANISSFYTYPTSTPPTYNVQYGR